MADGPFRYQQPANAFFSQHHPRNPNRPTSPPTRRILNTNTPSPSRSPAHAFTSQNSNMYNNNGFQQHPAMVNGTQNHGRFSGHQQKHHPNQYSHQTPIHHHPNHHGGQMGHQYNTSAGQIQSVPPHLNNYNHDHLQNGNGDSSLNDSADDYDNEHWKEQRDKYDEVRDLNGPNQRARTVAQHAKGFNHVPLGTAAEETAPEPKGPRNTTSYLQYEQKQSSWNELDVGGQGLTALSPMMFSSAYQFLTRLNLQFNALQVLPAAIGNLRMLTYLDISENQLEEIPEEVGMLTELKTFNLFNNKVRKLPSHLGFLHKLEFLGVYGNPLDEEYKTQISEGGSKQVVKYLLNHMEAPEIPPDRPWHEIEATSDDDNDIVRAMSYNILCERYATTTMYGYVPPAVLQWNYRKDLIFEEIRSQEADLVCLQELDKASYDDFFRQKFAECGYKGYFAQKSRAETLGDNAKYVDGCGTFWKDKKYMLLASEHLILGRKAVERPGGKASADMLNRVWQRDDIATVVFLENRVTGSRMIVVNAHIYWDPAFNDVRLIQAAVILEEVSKLAQKYVKIAPATNKAPFRFTSAEEEVEPVEYGPSLEYTSASQIPLIVCGDFNSAVGSAVYDLFAKKGMDAKHSDLGGRDYGSFSAGGMSHDFTLKSAYTAIEDEMPFTNYVPHFRGVLDHIWFSTNALRVTGLLGEIDPVYLTKVPGFPNFHYPSDHISLVAQFKVEKRRVAQKAVEADFGPGSKR